LDVELTVDEEKIPLNLFARKIFGGIITGAVTSLSGIPEDWKEIKLKVKKNG
jgi:hypothetical protein